MASAFGCGDNSNGTTSSSSSAGAGGQPSGSSSSASVASSSSSSSGMGGSGGGVGEKLISVPVSAMGHDRFFGVTFDAKGNIYATGVAATSTAANADFETIVAKFLPTGDPDPTFGTKGIATKNVAVGTNGEVTRGIVIQSTGKIVVSGTVEHVGAMDPRDRDIAVLRFNEDGTIDPTFGTNGVLILDLSAGEVMGTGYVADSQWGLSVYPDDKLLVVGVQKRPGGTDTDFAVVRLTTDGTVDTTFGTNGVTLLDINKQAANARTGAILADGSVVVSGYTRDANSVVSPVLFKLTPKGDFDMSFGVNGVFNEIVLASVTEAYGAAVQGTNFVTVGYGMNGPPETLDWISLRVSAAGALDKTYGDMGVCRIDLAGFNDNGRALVALPDNRMLLVGGGRPATDNVDGMVAVLTESGKPDTTFAPSGRKVYNLGGESDFFWGVALSPSKKFAAIVGVKGVGMGPGNDDAALLLLPVGN